MCTLIYTVTIDDVLHKLVDILLHFPSGSHDLSPAERELDPSHMAIHLIKEVAQGNEMCQEILCKVEHSDKCSIGYKTSLCFCAGFFHALSD